MHTAPADRRVLCSSNDMQDPQHARHGLQAVLVRQSARLLKAALLETDERSKLEGELVSGIEVIKCSAWEARLSLSRPTDYDVGVENSGPSTGSGPLLC